MTTKPIASEGLIERLRQLRVVLKSGDYDGADLMRAWCAMMDAADALQSTNRQLLLCREALEEARPVVMAMTGTEWAGVGGFKSWQAADDSLRSIKAKISKALEGSCPDVVGGEK